MLTRMLKRARDLGGACAVFRRNAKRDRLIEVLIQRADAKEAELRKSNLALLQWRIRADEMQDLFRLAQEKKRHFRRLYKALEQELRKARDAPAPPFHQIILYRCDNDGRLKIECAGDCYTIDETVPVEQARHVDALAKAEREKAAKAERQPETERPPVPEDSIAGEALAGEAGANPEPVEV